MTQSGRPASRQVSIERFQIRKGNLFVNDQKLPIELSWPNVEANLTSDAKNVLKGALSAGPGPMRFGDLAPQDGSIAAEARFSDSILHVEKGSFTAGASTLTVTGEVDLHNEPKGQFQVMGALNLEGFDRSIAGTGLGLKGIAQTKAVIALNGPGFTLAGTMRGQQGAFDSLPIEAFSTNVFWDGSNVRLHQLLLRVMGGKAALNVDALANAPVRVAGTLDALNAEPMLHWLFAYSGARLGARVSGPIDLSFPKGASNLLSGAGDLKLLGDPALGDPVSGVFPFKAAAGVITLDGAHIEAPQTTVTVSGKIQPDRHLGLDVKLTSQDLVVTDGIGTRLRAAFGAVNPQPLGFIGKGTLEGRVTGTTTLPVVTGHFLGTEIAYLGVPWGNIDWTGAVSTVDLKSDKLLATRGASRVEMRGTQRLGATGVDDAIDLSVQIKEWPAKELLKVIQSEVVVDGDVSGTMHLAGTRAKPVGDARLTAVSGKASGFAFAKADLALKFQGEALKVESLKASVGGGDLIVKGTLTTEAGVSAFAGDVEVHEVEIADLGLQAGPGPTFGGHVNGRATISGPIERPRVTAHLESTRIFYGDEGVGAIALDIEGKSDGLLNITAHSASPRFTADVTGTVDAKAPHMSHLSINLLNARIDPALRALGSRFENAVAITASATAKVEGPLMEPDSITASIREGRLKIAVPEYAIEAAPGFVIDVERRQIRIAGLNLKGEGTSLSVSGKIALRPDDDNEIAVTGRADLRVLSAFSRDWRARGSATLRSQIGGTAKSPRLSGGLDVEDGALRLRTFPQGLDGLNGRVIFNETQARVAGLEGRFGGGRVSVSGQMSFGGSGPPSFDFFLNGDQLGIRYPEGLRATFGAALRLQGTTEAHWLTGDLNVSKAIWTRKYAITSELFSTQTTSNARGGFSVNSGFKQSPMRLDIAIRAPGTLRLNNNLADIVANADLALTGSPTEPQLLGQVEIERGSVFFRGNTYEVRKGIAHFSNPREINPVFDIEADTRVRNYRLTLQANGTLDRVTTRITSDPPLTTTQIASLLTGGSENDIQRAGSSTSQLDVIGRGGVSALASTWLEENITGRVAEGFGLSRLSIEPGLFGRTDTRLTVGKRVTSALEVVYSRGLSGGSENQLATAEYSLT
ncbi:MAG: translocation/assembly module TamB domain-containing protein, partial [Vicinamibacteria bacterium]